jgi:ribose transport system substrate-binding protein
MTKKTVLAGIVLPLLIVLGALGLVACGGDDSGGSDTAASGGDGTSAEEEVQIAYLMLVRANSYTEAMLDGINEVAEEMNANVRVLDANFDAATQLNQMQDVVSTESADALIIHAVDANVLTNSVEDAIAAGMKVVAVDNPLGPDLETLEPQIEGLSSTVAYGIPENGENIGKLIVDACADKDPCKVGYIGGAATVPLEVSRVEGLKRILAENPNVDLVSEQEGADYARDTGLRVAQNILQANPDLDVLATSGDQMTLGAEQAVEDANLSDQVALVGNGASAPGVEAVQEGRWFGTTALVPFSTGRAAAEQAINAVRGGEVQTVILSTELSDVGALVTQDNAADFEAQWEG